MTTITPTAIFVKERGITSGNFHRDDNLIPYASVSVTSILPLSRARDVFLRGAVHRITQLVVHFSNRTQESWTCAGIEALHLQNASNKARCTLEGLVLMVLGF